MPSEMSNKGISSRTIKEIEECAKMAKRSKSKYYCSRTPPPCFRKKPISHVVDDLHMFLRIADVLINLLILDARRLDAVEQMKKFTEFDRKKLTYLSHL